MTPEILRDTYRLMSSVGIETARKLRSCANQLAAIPAAPIPTKVVAVDATTIRHPQNCEFYVAASQMVVVQSWWESKVALFRLDSNKPNPEVSGRRRR